MPTLLKRPHQHILRTETLIRDRFPSGLASGHPATTLRQECAGIFLEQSELNSALWGHAAWQQSPRLLLARAGFLKAREPTGSGAVGSTAPPHRRHWPWLSLSSYEGKNWASHVLSSPNPRQSQCLVGRRCSANTTWAVGSPACTKLCPMNSIGRTLSFFLSSPVYKTGSVFFRLSMSPC